MLGTHEIRRKCKHTNRLLSIADGLWIVQTEMNTGRNAYIYFCGYLFGKVTSHRCPVTLRC